MKILVTGSNGFIGKNLIIELKNRGYKTIFEYDLTSTLKQLDEYCKEADFVFHLAGVNRPKEISEFQEGNVGFTHQLLGMLKKHDNFCPVMISSTIQATNNTPYGISKRMGEELLLHYSEETGAKVLIYRFQNVFGKWSRPNYNGVVATFCNNIARDISITINNAETELSLIYIDDIVNELINSLECNVNQAGVYCSVSPNYNVTLVELANIIRSFRDIKDSNYIPNMGNEFKSKLYSTYLSYLPEDRFSYKLRMNIDERGSFTEFLKTLDCGQVSINVSKPGITKGNHWHHSKNEKFLVVSGNAIIRFRKIGSSKIIEYMVNGDELEVVDIPVGYTHNIENVGEVDLVTVMWANECYNPKSPDTFFMEV